MAGAGSGRRGTRGTHLLQVMGLDRAAAPFKLLPQHEQATIVLWVGCGARDARGTSAPARHERRAQILSAERRQPCAVLLATPARLDAPLLRRSRDAGADSAGDIHPEQGRESRRDRYGMLSRG